MNSMAKGGCLLVLLSFVISVSGCDAKAQVAEAVPQKCVCTTSLVEPSNPLSSNSFVIANCNCGSMQCAALYPQEPKSAKPSQFQCK
ncbi:hypothetical protein D9M70_562480 [compost metagenome]